MGAIGHDGLTVPGKVELAHEPPFRLGILEVEPATRQLIAQNRSETLEPRVMQVLVALYRAGGIVTRDELTQRCWDGRIVGDDAINRVLSRVRRIASDIGENSFSVETITKVGYRLKAGDGDEAALCGATADATAPASSRRAVLAAAAALGLVGVVGGAGIVMRAARSEGPPPEARALYERALAARHEARPAANRQSLAYLREAVRISPEYGKAWGALALAYRTAMDEEPVERTAGYEQRLQEAVRNAEHYDPGNADAAAALLPTSAPFGRWTSLEQTFRSSIRRHPEHALAYSLLGTVLMDVGRWTEAVRVLQAAKARNPSTPIIRYKLIVSLWSAGRISAAEEEIAEATRLWSDHGAVWQTRVKLLALTGRPKEALALVSDPATRPVEQYDAPDPEGKLVYLRALATRLPSDVDRAVEELLRRAREIEGDRVSIALECTALGRTDLALDLLVGALLGQGEWALRPDVTANLSTHPLFQPHGKALWSEPRFTRILEEIGLERYWRQSGTLPDYRRQA